MINIEQIPSDFLNFNIINYTLHNTSKGIEGFFYYNVIECNLTYCKIT